MTDEELQIAQLKQIRWATDRIMDAMFRPPALQEIRCPLCGELTGDLVTVQVEGQIQIKGCPACKVDAERSLRRSMDSYTDHHHRCSRCDEAFRCGCGWPGKPGAICEECASGVSSKTS